jgi:hypothetical protein
MTIPLGFAILLLVFAWLGPILGAAGVALWFGERGRRAAAERLSVYGTPETGGARAPTSMARGQSDAEQVQAVAEKVSLETRDRLAAWVLREAKARADGGEAEFEGYTLERATAEAEGMLADLAPAQEV